MLQYNIDKSSVFELRCLQELFYVSPAYSVPVLIEGCLVTTLATVIKRGLLGG